MSQSGAASSITEQIHICTFRPEYKAAFKSLNIEWLEKYFYVEEIDQQVLSHPEKFILEKGGEILFAVLENEVIGTVALMLDDNGNMELTKMAVTEKYQGLQIGKKLLEAAIQHFLMSGREKLFLESNSRLHNAIRLYEKMGFVHKTKKGGSHYERADVYMEFKPSN